MPPLKYIVFLGTLVCGVPLLTVTARRYPAVKNGVLFMTILFTSFMVDINFVSRETYRGTSRGFEFGMVDMSVLILLFLVLGDRGKYRVRLLPPGSILYLLYFIFSAISIVNAEVRLYSFFELFKMIRVYVFFWTMYNIIVSEDVIDRIVKYTSVIVILVFIIVMRDKYVYHLFQSKGPFPHQNSLVMYMIVFSCLHFSILMNVKGFTKTCYWLLAFGGAMICIISSLSRAGMALGVFGLSIVFLFQMSRRLSLHKIAVAFVLTLMAAGVMVKAIDSIVERFQTAPEESAETRVVLAQAAVNMANDKTIGVGLNNFSMKMDPKYPYSSHIDEEIEGGKAPIVETAYLLIAAETGWYNLCLFLIILLYFYFMNIINIVRSKSLVLKCVSIGFLGGLTAIYTESAFEWVLKQTNNFYQLFLVFAIIGGISKLNRRARLERAHAR